MVKLPLNLNINPNVVLIEVTPEQAEDPNLGGLINLSKSGDSRFGKILKSSNEDFPEGYTILIPKTGTRKFELNGVECRLVKIADIELWFASETES